MQVFIASPLHSYTGGRGQLEATGATVAEVLADLDRRYPGIHFRIVDEQDRVRPHIRIYLGTEAAAALSRPIPAGQEIHILQALSGGRLLDDVAGGAPPFAALDPYCGVPYTPATIDKRPGTPEEGPQCRSISTCTTRSTG